MAYSQDVTVKNANGLAIKGLTIKCTTDGQRATSVCGAVAFSHQDPPSWTYTTEAGTGQVCGAGGQVGPFGAADPVSGNGRGTVVLIVDPA